MAFSQENAPLFPKRRGISKSASPGSKASRARSRAHSLSARQNGRSLRCRPRPQQGPRGLHRQGRQHQLHDGVAAPRQQVRLPAPARARVSLERDDARFEVTAFSKIAARDASRDAIGAPRCADSARRDAPIASSDQTSIDRRRVIARSRRRASATRRLRNPRRAVFPSAAPPFRARAYPIPRSSACRFERAADAGGSTPGRPRAEQTRAIIGGTPPRGCPRRRLDGSHARDVPRASSRFRVSERRLDEGRSWLFPVRDRAVPANANRVSIDPRMRR